MNLELAGCIALRVFVGLLGLAGVLGLFVGCIWVMDWLEKTFPTAMGPSEPPFWFWCLLGAFILFMAFGLGEKILGKC